MLKIAEVFSSLQFSLELGLSAKWASGTPRRNSTPAAGAEHRGRGLLQEVPHRDEEHVLAPAGVFADTVTNDDAMASFGSDNPPGYVRSVDYGRILMVKMGSSAVDTAANLKGAFEQATSQAIAPAAGGGLSRPAAAGGRRGGRSLRRWR